MDIGTVFSHLAFALLFFSLLPVRRLPVAGRIAFLVGGVLLGMVAFGGLSLAAYLRSLTGDLAITTLLWLGWWAVAKIRGIAALSFRQHRDLAFCFSSLALLLYPATLGMSTHDPYRLGYSPRLLLAAVFAISVLFWWRRHYFGAILLTAATLFFALELMPSTNYWDYLIDPLLGLYGICAAFWHAGRWAKEFRQRGKKVSPQSS